VRIVTLGILVFRVLLTLENQRGRADVFGVGLKKQSLT